MSEKLLDDAAVERLSELFESIEHDMIDPGRHEGFHAMLGRLTKAISARE